MKLDRETIDFLNLYCGDDSLSQTNYDDLDKLTKFVEWGYDEANDDVYRISLRPYLIIRLWGSHMLLYSSYKKESHSNRNYDMMRFNIFKAEEEMNDETDAYIDSHGGYKNIDIKKFVLFKIAQVKKFKQRVELLKFKTAMEE